jgi:hypothetical protein
MRNLARVDVHEWLPKARLVELWKDNFGKEPGRIRPELMLPILAYRIQEEPMAVFPRKLVHQHGNLSLNQFHGRLVAKSLFGTVSLLGLRG